jgi:hypothetical protein
MQLGNIFLQNQGRRRRRKVMREIENPARSLRRMQKGNGISFFMRREMWEGIGKPQKKARYGSGKAVIICLQQRATFCGGAQSITCIHFYEDEL